MTPLKIPAKNTEQRIFKLVLFVVLPLLGILTAVLFANINANKNNVAEGMISTQSGNANKRMTIFLDPPSRDIAYLQICADKGELDPEKVSDIQRFLTSFCQFHLQNVKEVIFWDGTTTKIFPINQGECAGPEIITKSFYDTAFAETLKRSDSKKIDWLPAEKKSFLLAATVFTNSKSDKPNVVAIHIDTTEFFAGLEKYIAKRLFLIPDSPGRLPQQFILADEGTPDIEETKDAIILATYAKWKNNAAEDIETFHLPFDGQLWWTSIRRLEIKERQLYSGLILPESEMLSELIQSRRNFAIISLISFTIVLIATVYLWIRYQRDIKQNALPPAVNEMTDDKVLQAIAAGEDDRLEFKSTLRWNLRTNKPDKAMEIACLKTMAAFLNSEGGTLLVGVEDDGNILGIGADQFPNEDKFLLHFNNLINQHLGLETTDSFSFDIRHLETGDIMIVDCLPSPAPVYVTHDKKEDFYVRVGPGTRPLTTRDALEYIRNHF